MTREEQIKQAARDIALNWNVGRGNEFYYRLDKLTEMARWADEHPKNPWRDAETDPPKEKCKVYVLKNGEPDFAIYTGRKKNKTFVTAYLVRHLVGTCLDISENGIEFKKDVYALFRKDITSEVTHWMPIPELPKEDKNN